MQIVQRRSISVCKLFNHFARGLQPAACNLMESINPLMYYSMKLVNELNKH